MTAAQELDQLVERRNGLSARIGPKKQAGQDVTTLIREHAEITERIKWIQEGLSATAETGEDSDTRELRVEVVTQADEFEAMRDDWHQLEEASDNFSVFMSWEWMYTWWEVFGRGKQLHIITVRDHNDKLVGLVPVMRVRKLAGLRRSEELAFIGTGARAKSDYLGFMAAGPQRNRITQLELDRLLSDVADLGQATLSGIAGDDVDTGRLLAATVARGFACAVANDSVSVNGELPATFEEFIASVPSKNRRNYLRHQEERLRDTFDSVEYVECESRQDLPAFIEILGSLVDERVRSGIAKSAWRNEHFREFIERVCERLLSRGVVKLDLLRLDRRVGAAMLGFAYRGTHFCYQLGFDGAYAKYGPVHCLLGTRIRRLISDGVTRFEFGRGVARYKARYFQGRPRLLRVLVVPDEPEKLRAAGYTLFRHGMRDSVKRIIAGLQVTRRVRDVDSPSRDRV